MASIYECVTRAVQRLSSDGVKLSGVDVYGNEKLVEDFKKKISWVRISSKQWKVIPVDGYQITWLGKIDGVTILSPDDHVYYAVHNDQECSFFRVEYDGTGWDDCIRVVAFAPEYMLARLAKEPKTEAPADE